VTSDETEIGAKCAYILGDPIERLGRTRRRIRLVDREHDVPDAANNEQISE
jgi:hypothetical protein